MNNTSTINYSVKAKRYFSLASLLELNHELIVLEETFEKTAEIVSCLTLLLGITIWLFI